MFLIIPLLFIGVAVTYPDNKQKIVEYKEEYKKVVEKQ